MSAPIIRCTSSGITLPEGLALPAYSSSAAERHSPDWVPGRPQFLPGSAQIMSAEQIEQFRSPDPADATFRGLVALPRGADGSLQPVELDFRIPGATLAQHILLLGKPGSGKTTRALLQAMYQAMRHRRSVVVIDGKGDLTAVAMRMRRQLGNRLRFRFLSFTEPDLSCGYNPLAGAATQQEVEDVIKRFQYELSKSSSESPFWQAQAVRNIIMLIAMTEPFPEKRNLAYLAWLMDQDIYHIAVEFDKVGLKSNAAAEDLLRENVTSQGIRQEMQALLAPFRAPDIAAVTSAAEFKFAELAKPTLFILRVPEGRPRLAGLVSAFMQQLFQFIDVASNASPRKRLPTPITIVMDEFASSLGRLDQFSASLNTLRSRGVSFVAAVQHLAQITHRYGSAEAYIAESFGTYIALPPLNMDDARLLAARSGDARTVEYLADRDDHVAGQRTINRPVLTELDIGVPSVSHPRYGAPATVLLPNQPPFQAYFPPIWSYEEFRGWDDAIGDWPTDAPPKRRKPLVAPQYG